MILVWREVYVRAHLFLFFSFFYLIKIFFFIVKNQHFYLLLNIFFCHFLIIWRHFRSDESGPSRLYFFFSFFFENLSKNFFNLKTLLYVLKIIIKFEWIFFKSNRFIAELRSTPTDGSIWDVLMPQDLTDLTKRFHKIALIIELVFWIAFISIVERILDVSDI